ncbi:cellulase family glycosylhydrolase [Arachidicoccus sp.]|uniref:cellulase family glycosylhydrolase n=1 Tax=Arachidicoccus sp. TaxID=1872624 RepID=UPI003D1A189B
MQKSIFKTIIASIFIIIFSLRASAQGYLRVNGVHIENDENKNFILRGMGFGGWMLQEGYMFHLGFLGQQYKIKQKIASLIGEKETKDFYDKWLQYHTEKADIDSMAAWGFNSIRLPMHYRLFTLPAKDEPVKGKNTWLPKGFEMIDSLLSWCKQDHIYLILDLHAAPGGQGNDLPISDRNPDDPSLWQSQANQDKTVALWEELAKRYAGEKWIGGYDILNETNWGFDDAKDIRGTSEKNNIPLRNLFIQITKAIRSVDAKHIIFLEGNGFANNYTGIFPLWDKNMVISFHKYGNFNNQSSIQNFLDYRTKYKVPLWLGETGENSNNWFTHNIQLMENNDIGWSWWQLKKMGINNPLEIKEPKNYQQFVDYCAGKNENLSKTEAEQILNDLLQNIKIVNNIYHKDVIDAMFRQPYATSTLSFKPNIVAKNTFIQAVDYDLGRNGFAYNDADTASYMYTPGVHTQGNRGHTYRNDGVDIKNNLDHEPYVFSIENGEWLLYTTEVKKSGKYHITFITSSDNDSGFINLYNNDKLLLQNLKVENTGSKINFKSSKTKAIFLRKGINKMKIYFLKGGFNFKGFHLKAE